MPSPPAAPAPSDQWFVRNERLRAFVAQVNRARRRQASPEAVLAAVRAPFQALLDTRDWLPPEFQRPAARSGMGGGIGMWLLYRSGDGGLALSSLVVPAGAETPVHDHLTWGLVGVYQGRQAETVYRRTDDGQRARTARLEVAAQLSLAPGDCYDLLPRNDIHSVRTTSPETSVSIHLLGNDNGCTWRHQFDPAQQAVEAFRSGWLNADCREPAA